ncbi:MAG: 30S ribosomal protein S14 [Blastocatellia bacterium]|nr:30S ribosomal protein S14 [Blastocatellia bacterium]
MAKTSKVVRNEQRKEIVARYAEKRKTLKEIIRNPKSTDEERDAAAHKLHGLPRNASPTRVRNRCSLTGRTRGHLGKFGLCRIAFRDAALRGDIPGVKKSSW